ncbi:myb-related transcription factor%2C partner of profilin-like [Xyrichtys novacula]|uniref:Myb-related transcription factor, partner of profilin-like n=1 Tax=Xyrichtys novacula TaxID=13765 RepID=A0AAV1EZ01_XYRNO|nr:myb-related transcription factor%2C partner of profilin-like [Xyrichtys novacula]
MAEGISTRKRNFSDKETELLLREVQARFNRIYGYADRPPRPDEARAAWEEISVRVNQISSDVRRTASQCKKRFNDLRRRARLRLAKDLPQHTATTGSGPSTNIAPCAPGDVVSPTQISRGRLGPIDSLLLNLVRRKEHERGWSMPVRQEEAEWVTQDERAGHRPEWVTQEERAGHRPEWVTQEERAGHRPEWVIQEERAGHKPEPVIQEEGEGHKPEPVIQEEGEGHKPEPVIQEEGEGHRPEQTWGCVLMPQLKQEREEEDEKGWLVPVRQEEGADHRPEPMTQEEGASHKPEQEEDRPVLEIQRAGFTMMERELGAIEARLQSLETRVQSLEGVIQAGLLPLASVAATLERLANVADRLVPAPDPSTTPARPRWPLRPSTRGGRRATQARRGKGRREKRN